MFLSPSPSTPHLTCWGGCHGLMHHCILLVIEVFGREVSFGIPLFANCFDNWGFSLSFQLWLTWEPLSPNTGWNAPSWTELLLTVCLLFCVILEGTRQKAPSLQIKSRQVTIVIGQRVLTPGALGMCQVFSAKGKMPSRQRGALKGNKDATLLTPELQSTRQVVLSNLNLRPTAVLSLHSGTLWQAASKE